MGLKVSASGRGKVVSQSLAQNTNFNKGQQIKIQLN
jgi:beta-lactam-binding protein with PASTA domain